MEHAVKSVDGHGRIEITVGGLAIAHTSRDGLATEMLQDWRSNAQQNFTLAPKLVFSANGQSISMAGRDAQFRHIMEAADVVHADGMSVVFASKLLTRAPLPERVATTDFFHDAAAKAAKAGLRFYLLGGTPESNARAAATIRQRYPDLQLVGHRHGYFSAAEEVGVITNIMDTRPDVVWVSLGRPKQEYFCTRHRSAFTGVTWLKTCGGLVDFLAGDRRRAPDWMQKAGLEWAYRVAQEPHRLAWRYATTNVDSLMRMALFTRTAGRQQTA